MEKELQTNSTGRVKTYTKKDVTTKVTELRNEKFSTAEKWVDSVFVALREIMMQADLELRIEIRDFGVFEVKQTRSKPKARNPRTGENIYVPPRRKTHFKPSKLLKSFLQQPLQEQSASSHLLANPGRVS